MKIPAQLAVLLVSLLWGSEWLLRLSGDTSLSGLPPFRVLALRYFIAAIVLIPWAFPRRRRQAFSIPLLPNVLLGTVLIALPTIYLANRSDLSPGLVVLLFATIPLIASMLESSSGLTGAPALLGGLAGTAFLVRGSLSSSTSQAISLGGSVLIVVAIATVLVRAGKSLASANPPSSVPASVMVQMLTAGIVFAFYSLMFEHLQPVAWAGAQIAVVVILGAFGSAGAYCLFYVALRDLKVSQVSVVQWLIPAVGILETAILFRHLPEWGSLAGGMLSIGSAVVLLYAAKQGDTPLTLQITDAADQENARL